jgi:hypothetical protein
MKLRVLLSAACLLSLVSPDAFAQSAAGDSGGTLRPDQGEIESAKAAGIVFVNYEGPSARIDSLAEIKGIGSSLGRGQAGSEQTSVGDARYRVIHAIDLTIKEGLDADIIVLGADSQVDHIRNLRWIIAGYLGSAWGYAENDAYTLATFITIYNAAHRGELTYFASKYKAVVQKELSAENAGLALNYTQWPGESRIVIPLSSGAKAGNLGAVDTGAVSDKSVTESLKAQPDKGISDRQALVDVKEREAAQKQTEADQKKAEAESAERELAQAKAKADADRAALAAAQSAPASQSSNAAQPQSTAPATTGTASTGTSTSSGGVAASNGAATAELSTKEAAVKADEAAVKAKGTEVAVKQGEASQAQAEATAKKEEAAADRKDITADQKQVIAAEVADKGKAEAAGVYLVRVGDDADHLGQILFVDADKGTTIRSSRINSIHMRSLVELSDSFIAVAGLEGKAGGVKLERFDKASLESVAEGKPDLFAESPILVRGDTLYAIVKAADGKCYVAEFAAADLSEKARSEVAIAPYSLLRETAGGVAVQTPSGSFDLLKVDTLEKVKELKP